MIGPYEIDQPVSAHNLTGVESENRQHGIPPLTGDRSGDPVLGNVNWAENSHHQLAGPRVSLRRVLAHDLCQPLSATQAAPSGPSIVSVAQLPTPTPDSQVFDVFIGVNGHLPH
ncbi:hypothetical protein GCM10022235_58560 [Kribbella ginsengisoli]|uniref:Uncharacterized protein n=1 Tax=Kribbella ginsengisoli TaxID=363865 RepID=A0ABP6YBN8_9ACTN